MSQLVAWIFVALSLIAALVSGSIWQDKWPGLKARLPFLEKYALPIFGVSVLIVFISVWATGVIQNAIPTDSTPSASTAGTLFESTPSFTSTVPPTFTPLPPTPTRPAIVDLRFTAWKVNEQADELLLQLLEEFGQKFPSRVSEPVNLASFDGYLDYLLAEQIIESPDVYALYESLVPYFIKNEFVVPLDSYFAEDFKETDLNPDALDFFRGPDGRLYGIPRGLDVFALLYDAEAFSSAGYEEFPESWQEFEKALEALSDPQKNYFGACVPDGYIPWVIFYYQDSSSFKDYDKVASQRAAERLLSLLKRGLVTTPDRLGVQSCVDGMNDQRVASAIATYNTLEAIKAELKDGIQIETAEIPGGLNKATLMFVDGYVMSFATMYPRESWKLIAYLTSEDASRRWVQADICISKCISPRSDVAKQQAEEDKSLRPFVEGARYAKGAELTSLSRETLTRLDNLVTQLGSGEIDLETFSQEVDSAIQNDQGVTTP
jgi:multiple sugar transport system substrate-binding protein